MNAHTRRLPAALAALGGLAGCEVKMGAAQFLWALWLVPLLGTFLAASFKRRQTLLARFVHLPMVARLCEGVSAGRQAFKAALLLIAVTALILCLCEPKWGYTWEDVHRQGVDIVVAIDVSESMLVQDVESDGKLSRLERAKREIYDLLRIMDGDRIGLVAFAGAAFIECPLTLDYNAAGVFLDDIDTDLIPVKGTALADGIRSSLKALENSPQGSQAIILITDGEDHEGSALKAAEEAKDHGVRVFAVGIGRDEGAPIPVAGGGFHRDERGNLVLSRLDEPALQKIAATTGGRYVRSVTGEMDLEAIYKQGIKATLQSREYTAKRRQRWHERYQWVLLVALLALGAEALLPERVEAKHA